MKNKNNRWPSLLAWVLLGSLGVAWGAWAWIRGEIVLTRHWGQAEAGEPFSLQTQLFSSRPAVRLAAAQRLAELGSFGRSAESAVVRQLKAGQDSEELGWFLAYAVSQWDDDRWEALAALALAGHEVASERFLSVPADERTEAVLELFVELNLDQEDQAQNAQNWVRWLGGAGPNASSAALAGVTTDPQLAPLVLLPPMSVEMAGKVAAAIMEFYRGHDMPDTALHALVQLGEPAVPVLAQELDQLWPAEVHFSQRERIYRAFRLLGPLARSAEPVLHRAIRSEPINLAFQQALLAVVAIDPVDRLAATEIIRAANDPVRWEDHGYNFELISPWCVTAIEDLGAAETIAGLLAEFQRRDPTGDRSRPAAGSRRASWRIARKLGELGPRAETAAPALHAALRSDWPEVRLEAALALQRIGSDTADATAVLLDFLQPARNSPENIALALVACSEIGEIPESAGPQAFGLWEQLVRDGATAEIRQLAADSLHKRAPNDDGVTEVLMTALLSDPEASVRRILRDILAQRTAGDDPSLHTSLDVEQAIAWLQANWQSTDVAFRSGENDLQVLLATNLLRHRPAEAAVAIAEWLATDGNFPPVAAIFFDRLGDGRRAALPGLIAAARSDVPEIRDQALLRIANMKSEAATAFGTVAVVDSAYRTSTLRQIDPQRYVRDTRLSFEYGGLLFLPGVVLLLAVAKLWRGWVAA